jgi:enamine deaminase RidA (YjgF/YER057c/UK114 family)
VVQLPSVERIHAAVLPEAGKNLPEQLRDCLGRVRSLMDQHGAGGPIVGQTLFVSDIGQLGACRRLTEVFYGREMPATTYVPQAPCQKTQVAIEAVGLGHTRGPIQVDWHSKQVVVVRHDGLAWCHCGGVGGACDGALYPAALTAFSRMERLIEQAGFSFSHVVRTWLYLGKITEKERVTQRYQELNRARADFFANVPFGNRNNGSANADGVFYPASTGIGAQGEGFTISSLAVLSNRADLAVVPLENPNQISAFSYDARYSPRRPRFSRAVAVMAGDQATIFVSGTASIIGAECRYPDDVERQAHQTLDNIAVLVGPDNCTKHGLQGLGATLGDLAFVRVYVKHLADYEKVHHICRERMGTLPVIYAVADVCRPELLVEIEGVAYATCSSPRCLIRHLSPSEEIRTLTTPRGAESAHAAAKLARCQGEAAETAW